MRSDAPVSKRRRARSGVSAAAFALLLITVLAACDPTTVEADPTLVGSARPKRTTTTTSTTSTTTTTPTGSSGGTLFADNFDELPLLTPWLDDSVVGGWTSVYNGYGVNDIELDGSQVLSEAPKVSTKASETHASLVVTSSTIGDFDATVRMKTVQQLRVNSAPNPWEVGWVLWHHTDDTHFYYFVPKPNGWELGKEDPAYPGAQRYLVTASTPTFPVGPWYTVRIRQVGSTITVWVNGAQLTSFTDAQRPYTSGHFGLYNEDSHVRFDDVTVQAP